MANTPATSMAELLKNKSFTATALTKGQMIEGTITKLTPQEITIDLSAKAEAVVLEHDKGLLASMLSLFHVGDKVMAQVLSTEGENGLPVVSLRRFMDSMRWKTLENALESKEKLKVKVASQVKGGYTIVSPDGLGGFLPNSYTAGHINPGEMIDVSIVEINKETKRFVVSQKTSLSRDDFKKLSKRVKINETVTATIESGGGNVYGVAIALGEEVLPGVLYKDEVSWDGKTELKIGDTITAQVTHIDSIGGRVTVSMKRLTKDPLAAIFEKYPTDTSVSGKVISVDDHGITLDINEGEITGFIKSEKMGAGTYEVGGKVSTSVIGTDSNNRKILLSPVLTEKPMFYR